MSDVERDRPLPCSADRDSWCTPPWLTDLLPEVDLDPCSNNRSTVKARQTYDLSRHEDGLKLEWAGRVFCNCPYGNPLPWAQKLDASPLVTACAFLINADPSTKWWRLLASRLTHALFFTKRIQFVPPPGAVPSTNSKPQALLMDSAFLAMCSPRLLSTGAIWSTRH